MLRDRSLHPLSRQHHNALALGMLARRALAKDFSPEAVALQCRKAVDRFDLEIRNHFEVEEQILFPAIVKALGPMPQVGVLIAQHRRMEQQIEELRTEPSREGLLEFLELLRKHVRTEENELFEDIQRRLPAGVLQALGPAIAERAIEVCLE